MTAAAIIKKLSKLPPKTKILVSNDMGMPTYDYEGQRFEFTLNVRRKTISLKREVDGDDSE